MNVKLSLVGSIVRILVDLQKGVKLKMAGEETLREKDYKIFNSYKAYWLKNFTSLISVAERGL